LAYAATSFHCLDSIREYNSDVVVVVVVVVVIVVVVVDDDDDEEEDDDIDCSISKVDAVHLVDVASSHNSVLGRLDGRKGSLFMAVVDGTGLVTTTTITTEGERIATLLTKHETRPRRDFFCCWCFMISCCGSDWNLIRRCNFPFHLAGIRCVISRVMRRLCGLTKNGFVDVPRRPCI
jgi:hypothetical protein